MSAEIELTDDERRAIASLKRLAKRWPPTLWIFCGSGSVCVMRAGENGEKVHADFQGYDQNYMVDFVDMPNDGGDW